jgi:hypothetical protein
MISILLKLYYKINSLGGPGGPILGVNVVPTRGRYSGIVPRHTVFRSKLSELSETVYSLTLLNKRTALFWDPPYSLVGTL